MRERGEKPTWQTTAEQSSQVCIIVSMKKTKSQSEIHTNRQKQPAERRDSVRAKSLGVNQKKGAISADQAEECAGRSHMLHEKQNDL